ncbi:MAG: hypothetical protein WC758_04330 [Candidatus Woesearchaeota archaeon]|jgi:hypothetical protein
MNSIPSNRSENLTQQLDTLTKILLDKENIKDEIIPILVHRITNEGNLYVVGTISEPLNLQVDSKHNYLSLRTIDNTYKTFTHYLADAKLWDNMIGDIRLPANRYLIASKSLTKENYEKTLKAHTTIIAVGEVALRDYFALMQEFNSAKK